MGKKRGVSKVPQARRVIGHAVQVACKVSNRRSISKMSTVQREQAEQVRHDGVPGDGTAKGPENGRRVVTQRADVPVSHVKQVRCDIVADACLRLCPGCAIGEICYADEQLNPINSCQVRRRSGRVSTFTF